MKKYLLLLLIVISAGAFAQVQSDAAMTNYVNTWIKSGGSPILGDTLNTALIYLINSKVHPDSLDLDELANVNTDGKLTDYILYWNATTGKWQDTIITLAGGTVTSVSMLAPSNEFLISGVPITGIGTIQMTWKSQAAKKFLSSPNGSSGTPSFRLIVPSDLPDLSATYSTLSHTHSNYQLGSDTNTYDATRYWVMNNFSGGSGEQMYADTARSGYDATYFYVDSLFGTMGGGGLYWSDTTGDAPNIATKYFVGSQGFLTSEVDGSTSNELQDLTWDAVNGHVEISNGNDADIGMFATTGTNYGLVPGSNNQTSYFLRGDGQWAAAGGTHPTLYNLSLGTGLTFSAGSGTSLIHTGAATIGIASGYYLPTTTDQTNWGSAYTHSTTTGNPHSTDLDDINNPSANKTFTMSNKTLVFSYNNPTGGDGAFEVEAVGAFTGDLVHIHQLTGNPGSGTDLLHLEASDADVNPMRVTGSGGTMTVNNLGQITAAIPNDDATYTGIMVSESGLMKYRTKSEILSDIAAEPALTKGNLTESVTGLEFDQTRQVIGGAAALSLTTGYVIPTTTQETNWTTGYNHVASDGDISASNELQDLTWDAVNGHVEISNGADADIGMFATTGTNYGLVPGSNNATSAYLRGDGTWVVPPGGGNVSNTGTPLNDQVAIWTNSTTIEGDADLSFNGTKLTTTQLYITTPTAGAGDYDKFLVLDVSGTEVKTRTGTEVASDIGALTSEVDGSVSNEGSLSVAAGSGTSSELVSNTSGSTNVTINAAGIISISETASSITLTGTEVDGSTLNEIEVSDEVYSSANFNGGTGQAVSQDDFYDYNFLSDADDDGLIAKVDLASAGFVKTDASGNLSVDGSTYLTGETDGSVTNEGSLSVAAGTGTSSELVSNTSGSTNVTINASGIIAISETASSITLTGTEVDGSVSNEGSLTVQTGGSDDSQIQSNTSGSTNVTISAGTNIDITESAPTITIAAEADVVDYTGTQAANNVSYFTENGNTISGEAAFTYDASTNTLTADIQKGSQWFDITTTTYSGITETWTAGTGGISAYDLVYISGNGTILKADRDAVGTAKVIGIATAAITQGATGVILTRGVIYNSAWNWTANASVYNSSTAGEVTTTVPATAGYGQKVGSAIDADRLEIQIGSLVGF